MDDNDFYEDDEPIAAIDAAWKRGEPGVTSGSRDLNQRAKSVVDRAVPRWDADDEAAVEVEWLPTGIVVENNQFIDARIVEFSQAS